MSKTCPKCLTPDAKFYSNRKMKDGLAYWCSDCANDMTNKWKQANKDKVREHQRRSDQKHLYRCLGWVLDIFREEPCLDCKRRFPVECMDFDHLGGKEFELARWRKRRTSHLAALMVEMAKCEVVCACCHRIRSRKRLQSAAV